MLAVAWNGVSLVTEPWTCDRKLVASEQARVFWVTGKKVASYHQVRAAEHCDQRTFKVRGLGLKFKVSN